MMRRFAMLTWLTIVWMALWGQITLANFAGGIVIGGVIVALVDHRPRPGESRVVVRPWPTAVFAAMFVRDLVRSNVSVTRRVLSPKPVQEAIVVTPLPELSDFVALVVANAITLTPGTVTVDLQRGAWIAVHVLDTHDPKAVRHDVNRILRRAARAFAPPATLAAVEALQVDAHSPGDPL